MHMTLQVVVVLEVLEQTYSPRQILLAITSTITMPAGNIPVAVGDGGGRCHGNIQLHVVVVELEVMDNSSIGSPGGSYSWTPWWWWRWWW